MTAHRPPSPATPAKRAGYFNRLPGAPAPLRHRIQRRITFGEVDAMAMAWHGRYATFFEESSTELRRLIGLSYPELMAAGLRLPIVRFHVDYHESLRLDEAVSIETALVWNEAARLDMEYAIFRSGKTLATTGYTVQLFTDAATGSLLLASPDLLDRVRQRWKAGEWADLQ